MKKTLLILPVVALMGINTAHADFYILDEQSSITNGVPVNQGVTGGRYVPQTRKIQGGNYGYIGDQVKQQRPAGFNVSGQKRRSPLLIEPLDSKSMVQIAQENEKKVTGFSAQSSVRQLFDQVAPKDWNLNCPSGDCDKPVMRWRADEPVAWTKLMKGGLESAKRKLDINYKIDQSAKTISVWRSASFVTDWKLTGNKSLKENLKDWADAAGFQLKWNVKDDWDTGVSQSVRGTFESAVAMLFSAYNQREVRITYAIHDELRVLEVNHKSSMFEVK